MPQNAIAKHFSDKKYHAKNTPIFMSRCYDEKCELKGNFKEFIILNYDNIIKILKKHEKSVDYIIFSKKVQNKKVNVLLCELTTGKKKQREVIEKMKNSGEYIIKVLEQYGFRVTNFDCIYLGRYEEEKRLKKTNKFSISGCSRNDLKIRQYSCGIDIKNIKNLNLLKKKIMKKN